MCGMQVLNVTVIFFLPRTSPSFWSTNKLLVISQTISVVNLKSRVRFHASYSTHAIFACVFDIIVQVKSIFHVFFSDFILNINISKYKKKNIDVLILHRLLQVCPAYHNLGKPWIYLGVFLHSFDWYSPLLEPNYAIFDRVTPPSKFQILLLFAFYFGLV